jgi:hypothetical protein
MSIRPAYPTWATYDLRLREVVGSMSDEQLAIEPGDDRWPLWATVGHLACQRVFWLCDVAGAPGAQDTPFTRAATNCPGDDDLVHVLSSGQLVDALASTFRVVEHCLDTWTLDALAQTVAHPEWGEEWTHTRGFCLERVFAHDIAHCAELNESLSRSGLPQIDLWE